MNFWILKGEGLNLIQEIFKGRRKEERGEGWKVEDEKGRRMVMVAEEGCLFDLI